MFKKDKSELEKIVKELKADYNFRGLYHFTDFSNLDNIFNSGFLMSRVQCESEGIDFWDTANQEVIEHTEMDVKEAHNTY